MTQITFKNAQLFQLFPIDGQAGRLSIKQDKIGVRNFNMDVLFSAKNSTQTITQSFLLDRMDGDVQYLINFFIDKLGMANSFWMPSFTPDFKVDSCLNGLITCSNPLGMDLDGETVVLTQVRDGQFINMFEGLIGFEQNTRKTQIQTNLGVDHGIQEHDILFVTRLARFMSDDLEIDEISDFQTIDLQFKLLETTQEGQQ
jgi:hypothetical protein